MSEILDTGDLDTKDTGCWRCWVLEMLGAGDAGCWRCWVLEIPGVGDTGCRRCVPLYHSVLPFCRYSFVDL